MDINGYLVDMDGYSLKIDEIDLLSGFFLRLQKPLYTIFPPFPPFPPFPHFPHLPHLPWIHYHHLPSCRPRLPFVKSVKKRVFDNPDPDPDPDHDHDHHYDCDCDCDYDYDHDHNHNHNHAIGVIIATQHRFRVLAVYIVCFGRAGSLYF